MPFTDELDPGGVVVLPYQPSWAIEGAELVARLEGLVPEAVAVEHIGSTSIPGMAAKPCIDLMVLVADPDASVAAPTLSRAGYRRRPEPWNTHEWADGRDWPKIVFAAPLGEPRCNIHLRPDGAASTRLARAVSGLPDRLPGQGGALV